MLPCIVFYFPRRVYHEHHIWRCNFVHFGGFGVKEIRIRYPDLSFSCFAVQCDGLIESMTKSSIDPLLSEQYVDRKILEN